VAVSPAEALAALRILHRQSKVVLLPGNPATKEPESWRLP